MESISNKEAWQLLGKEVPPTDHWSEACKAARLDWAVEKRPLLDSKTNKPIDHFGIFRDTDNHCYGVAGAGYTPLQNAKVFAGLDSFVRAEKGVHYVGAGEYPSGHKPTGIWCLVALPEQIRIKGTDDVQHVGLIFENPHEPGKSARCRLYELRLICTNGSTQAIVSKAFAFAHRPNIELRVEQAHASFEAIREQIRMTETVMNGLAKVKLTEEMTGQILTTVFPDIADNAQQANRARSILELWEGNDNGAFPTQAGSAYALYNATTNFVDHNAGVRERVGETEDVARARASLFGVGEVLKFTMLNSIVMNLTRDSLLSVSEKEAKALGLKL